MTPQAAAQPSPKALGPGEIAAFCAQVSLILKAGIALPEGMAILCEDAGDRTGREILDGISRRVDAGEPLYTSLAAGGHFPKYMVDMVEIGEASGRLDQVMDALCGYYQRQEDLSRSIKAAVTYPMAMIFMMLLTVFVLVAKVLPIFGQVFRQLGSEMTAFSQNLLSFGAVLGRVVLVLLAVLAAGAAALLVLRSTAGGRRWLSRRAQSFFPTRDIAAKMAAGRFADAMALTLSSGLDVDHALELAGRLADNPRVSQGADRCRRLLREGVPFADALNETRLFSGLTAKMAAVGIRAGAADQVMRRIADRYADEVDDKISGIVSVLEPTLVAVLSVIVGAILLSVMLPLMGIMSSIG